MKRSVWMMVVGALSLVAPCLLASTQNSHDSKTLRSEYEKAEPNKLEGSREIAVLKEEAQPESGEEILKLFDKIENEVSKINGSRKPENRNTPF